MEKPAGRGSGIFGGSLYFWCGNPFKPRYTFPDGVDAGATENRGKEKYAADELGRVQNELTGKVCASCDSCALCWERDCTPLYGILSSMITSIWQVGEPGAENEAELKKYCAKSRDMVEEAVRVFERVSLNHAWYNRLLENRQVIAEQLDAMAYII